jgi:formylglycine-generating enzyme required for sulfatase activity
MSFDRILRFILIALLPLLLVSCKDSSDDNSDTPQPTPTPAGMVKIVAKDYPFSMGSTAGLDDELPVHTVSFTHDFWMDTIEVVQSDYNQLMHQYYSAYTAPTWANPYGVGASYPVYSVYWGDAALYCNARSRRDGLDTVYTYTSITGTPGNLCELVGVTTNFSANGYRLPTEAEWEFACRAGSTTDYYWGKDFDPYPQSSADTTEFNAHAVWYVNSWALGSDLDAFGIHIAGGTTPNAFGLRDMAGNVYEWCNDWYGAYSAGAATDPAGPATGDWHCLRGGSWGSQASFMRSANRTFSIPDYIYYFIGFRVVRMVP